MQGEKKNSSVQVPPTSIFIIASFGLPTFLKRMALLFASQLYPHCTAVDSHSTLAATVSGSQVGSSTRPGKKTESKYVS